MHRKGMVLRLFLMLVVFSLLMVSMAPAPTSAGWANEVKKSLLKDLPKLKVAVLHFGPIGDYGWTYEAHLGAQKMAEELPYVELSEREEAYGPDATQIMREYADVGK
jgi:basic membrane lipoprotein Med (substrate-binding protein (PBP1-ABC) superfamily)